ncbi:Hypothetical protein, putative [Bodo saltans]|uniref:Uncharacterized protein n=1 Tax=Bodo saltans TaxID=75058 RepID=A0A0S4JR79_BODSA|nr:Hypothetical protein, putative [Bodo saltans]|eukprot:CUG92701.1 Hypothetical protein, putative [Bodo saltans]
MPGGAPLVANVGSLPTAIPTKQQPQQQQRQSASASQLDDLWWATPSYQLNVVTAPPPNNHNHFTNTAGHESSSSTINNDAQQQGAPFDQQRRGISNAAGLLNANTGQVGGNGNNNNNNNIAVAQIQTLSMLLDQCDKFVVSILHGGPMPNATTPSVSPTPPHRSSVALSQQQQQQQQQQAFASPRGNSLTIRGKIEELQQQHRRASPLLMGVFRAHQQHNHHYNRQQQQPLEMSESSGGGGGGGTGASYQRFSVMTRSSSSGTSAMSKRGQDSVGEDEEGGDVVGATFIPRTALERSPVSSTPQSLVPEASHPPLVDMHATCDSPQWGVTTLVVVGQAVVTPLMMEVHHNIINNSAHVGASSQQTATTIATATQPQRSALERNLSICSQLAAPPQAEGASHMQQRQAPSLHASPMTGALPTVTTASKSLPPSLNSSFSASSLLEIQKHIQAAQMIVHNEWIQNKNLVVVVDTATPIIRTPVGPSPNGGGGGGGAGGSSGTSFPRAIPQHFLEDDVSLTYMFPPPLQHPQQQLQQQQIAATAFVAFGAQNSDATSGIHKPSSTIGRRGGSVSSGVDAVWMFAPPSTTAALPSWPQGGQSPAVNDDFHHHAGHSVASLVDDMLSSTTTTTVRAGGGGAGGGGTNKSAASPSLVSLCSQGHQKCNQFDKQDCISRPQHLQSLLMNSLATKL